MILRLTLTLLLAVRCGYATHPDDVARLEAYERCALYFAGVARSAPELPGDGLVDGALVARMEELYHHRDESLRSGREYAALMTAFLAHEYRRMDPSLRAVVDGIRAEGKIPVFRAVIGDWVDPRDQEPFDSDAIDREQSRLEASGLTRQEVTRALMARFRGESVSTSLALTPAIEVALAKRKYIDPTGRLPVTITISAWDGGNGASGADPLEITLPALSLDVRGVFPLNRSVVGFYDANLRESMDRTTLWPALIEQVPNIRP